MRGTPTDTKYVIVPLGPGTKNTGTTRWLSVGHGGKGNQKNFGKKLFMTDPLGALFTKFRRGTF